jgi:hypothetical protein
MIYSDNSYGRLYYVRKRNGEHASVKCNSMQIFFNKKAKRHFELTILLKPFKQQDTDQKTIASDPV